MFYEIRGTSDPVKVPVSAAARRLGRPRVANTGAAANSRFSRAAPAARRIRLREQVIMNHIGRICPFPASQPGRAGILIAFVATAAAVLKISPP
jgi:hypothetical protein